MKQLSKKNIIIICIIAIALSVGLGLFFVLSTKPKTPPAPPPEVPMPTLVVEQEIVIDKFCNNRKIAYTKENLGDYVLTISIENTNLASLENDIIKPKAVGTTKIIYEINCEPKISKTTTLVITDVVTDVDLQIKNLDDSAVENFYCNQTYKLIITQNVNVLTSFEIDFDESLVGEFEEVSTNCPIYVYTFKIKQHGQIKFEFVSEYCEKEVSIFAYVYPSNFDVDFDYVSPNNNNEINLYLFNTNFTEQANLDGYQNYTNYCINTMPNSNDEVEFELTGDCVSIANNKISAISEGVANLTFTSKISGESKTFKIIVGKIKPTSILINDEPFEINASLNKTIVANTPYEFKVEVLPAYAYGDMAFETQNVTLENDILTLNESTGLVQVVFNNQTILTINYSLEIVDEYKIDIYVTNNKTSNVTLDGDTLKVDYLQGAVFEISCIVYKNDVIVSPQVVNVEISDENVLKPTNGQFVTIDGLILFKLFNAPTDDVTLIFTFADDDTNLTRTISVVFE
ncbi:MAG: hypothetical protein E7378_03400 [Clostridiales bacterium]|nr:hypothetical protein [Clostridiales bacterium]